MAEKLFKQLETTNKRFEVKLMILDVISRLIGLHDLFLLNFYPYIQRFLQPHQREVTKLLKFVAQASHELLPPDVMQPVLKTLVNNFVTERNSSDAMAIGLNAVREICVRCPLAMDEDLLRDLAQYKTYRERSVMMAAKSLIHLFRQARPELLHKRDRGRPTEASAELHPRAYGQVNAHDHVPGAEVLLKENSDEIQVDSESGSDDDEWIDIPHSSDEEAVSGSEASIESEDENSEANSEAESDQVGEQANVRKILKAKHTKGTDSGKKELAKKVTLERILTDEDFKRIDAENVRKQMIGPQKGIKRKIEESSRSDPSEIVKMADIENIYKKRKHDKQARIESVRKGQMEREKYGYKDGRVNIHCSKTNREKRKTKSYQMIKHKAKGKVKRSFKDKQIALRNHLLKLKRMK